jgi:hypothetical protein
VNFFKNLFRARPVNAYWWKEVPNFGDALAPLLLEHFADIEVEWATVSHASVASIGSILEHLPPLWDGYVLGSGKLFETSRLHNMRMATILAVRGPLSARSMPGNPALGDPGLLAAELVGPQEKVWDLGVVPHWQDNVLVPRFKRIMPKGTTIKVINPKDDPLTVLREIGSCRRIVTSSLHGMIAADSFGGIPRRVEICPAMAKEGGDFKFRDYHASLRIPFVTDKMTEPHRARVEDVQSSIYDAYKALAGALK